MKIVFFSFYFPPDLSAGSFRSVALSKALEKTHSFKIRMAYFPVESKNPIPDIELDIAMRADGIVLKAVQEFGDYSIEAKLNQIKFIEKAGC